MRLDLDQISDSPNPVFVPLRTQCRRSAYAVCVQCGRGTTTAPTALSLTAIAMSHGQQDRQLLTGHSSAVATRVLRQCMNSPEPLDTAE